MTTSLRDFLCARTMLLAIAAILPVLPLTAGAADDAPWPRAKPITWLIGYPPGGSVDVMARAIANKLTERTGQPVVIDNRPGASGMIALQAAARAPADGYTMVTVPGPDLFKQKVPEIGTELSAVAMIAQGPMVLVGSGSLPSADLKALLQEIRRDPTRWSYGTSGIGTSQHLAGELLNLASCAADFNTDGGVDGFDIDAFFPAWESEVCAADLNDDGRIDDADVAAFFTAWEAGGC